MLAGRGPCLDVYTADGTRILSSQIFDSQPVLGIKVALQDSPSPYCPLLVVTWGGSQFRLGRLSFEQYDTTSSHSIPDLRLGEPQNGPDWVLDAVFDGHSALMLTAHNQLLEMPLVCNDKQDAPSNGSISIFDGPQSFLYSGCLSISGPSSLIIASGTVFGEILVWTCEREAADRPWLPRLRHVLLGHKGSIFGVAVSHPFDVAGARRCLLASCSDDRTVRIWDISDCYLQNHKALNATTSTQTGFGHVNHVGQHHIASSWGHVSRIWNVEFVQTGLSGRDQGVILLSRGEDGVCQVWSVGLHPSAGAEIGLSAVLTPESSSRHHLGKNIWSMCQQNDDRGLIVHTGGADGQIISRKWNTFGPVVLHHPTTTISFNEITASALPLKHYLLLNDHECLASTDQGHLFKLTIKQGKIIWRQIHDIWRNGSLTMCLVENHGFVLLAHHRGGIFALLPGQESVLSVPSELDCGVSWMQVASNTSADHQSVKTCIVAVLTNRDTVVLWVGTEEGSIQMSYTSLKVPDSFTITACHYHRSSKILILGSRRGTLAVYTDVEPESRISGDLCCLHHVHGTDSVTSVSVLPQNSSRYDNQPEGIHVLTTGRDGNYAIHRIELKSHGRENQPVATILHLSAPPFGPNIEGAYLAAPEGPSANTKADLILYGFRSTSFVVWNETQQKEILSVVCGGPHRLWSFKDAGDSFINATKSFIWTKAKTFNWHNSPGTDHKVVQRGGHGREIKAVTRFPSSFPDLDDSRLMATGAEDTNIQIFKVSRTRRSASSSVLPTPGQLDSHIEFDTIVTLKKHTTGLQHLQFSPSGQYLFSSAGYEEFYVWKLSFDVPYIDVGAVLWEIMPSEEEDSDARIMSFDLQCSGEEGSEAPEMYTILMAYSNGKSKLVRYIPATIRKKGRFETLREIQYGSFCMMQASLLRPLFGQLDQSPQERLRILSAGTNGYLNLNSVAGESGLESPVALQGTMPDSAMQVQKVHQSSILSMDIVTLNAETHLIATGGDDNALGLTLLVSLSAHAVEPKSSDGVFPDTSHHFRTLLIPSAHAAAVTALKATGLTHGPPNASVIVISVSNDQRINVWQVCVEHEKTLPGASANAGNDTLFEAMQVNLVGSAWTGVADVSGIEILDDVTDDESDVSDGSEGHGRTCSIMVVGVGMEVVCLKFDSDAGHRRT